MNEVHIHLGLPKCASTSIQTVYGRQHDCCYIGKGLNSDEPYLQKDLEQLFRRDILLLGERQFSARYARGHMLSTIGENVHPVILSDEILSTIGFYTFYKSSVGFAECVRRLDYVFAGADIKYHMVRRNWGDFELSYFHQLQVSHGFQFSVERMRWHLQREKPEFKKIASLELPKRLLGSRLTVYDFETIVAEGMPLFHKRELLPLPKTNAVNGDKRCRRPTIGRRMNLAVKNLGFLMKLCFQSRKEGE